MLAGEPYLASDPELREERRRARRLTRLYNQTTEEERERRTEILRELFGGMGAGIDVEPPFYCDYGSNIVLGDNVFMNFGCIILDCNVVHIGDAVQCGPGVQIYAAYHPTDPVARLAAPELSAPVTIGANTTIGAGSVVTRDIPANVVAAGNPCRVMRTLP